MINIFIINTSDQKKHISTNLYPVLRFYSKKTTKGIKFPNPKSREGYARNNNKLYNDLESCILMKR